MSALKKSIALVSLFGWTFTGVVMAQFDFEDAPINYETAAVNDCVAQLVDALNSGAAHLQWDESKGWLPSLLEALEVSAESQTLVFSKTSFQADLIWPGNPRAIYFSDDVYVGYVPGGRFIELAAVDARQGAIFYSLDQNQDRPSVIRDQTECMTCHGTGKTKNVPGFLVRSVFAEASGQPDFARGTTTTDHTTPFKDRFGGWYVTGNHADLRHRGNMFIPSDSTEPADLEPGANQMELPSRVNTENFSADSSDLVALMVLEHQSQMHNLITLASWETRRATFYDKTMNELFQRAEEHVSESTVRRIRSVGDKLLEYMLFSGEAKLGAKISGTSDFARQFEQQGPADSRGRSLRQFDLSTRMFRYPCSFLIYSESFSQLPKPVLDYVENRLAGILLGQDDSASFAHLTDQDRKDIRDILVETKPGFAERVRQLELNGE